ncbi:hypothetical protein Tco_0259789 [Tanacetum coccineum]
MVHGDLLDALMDYNFNTMDLLGKLWMASQKRGICWEYSITARGESKKIENYADSTNKESSCDDVEDLDAQQYIVSYSSAYATDERKHHQKRYMANNLQVFEDPDHPNQGSTELSRAILWPCHQAQEHGMKDFPLFFWTWIIGRGVLIKLCLLRKDRERSVLVQCKISSHSSFSSNLLSKGSLGGCQLYWQMTSFLGNAMKQQMWLFLYRSRIVAAAFASCCVRFDSLHSMIVYEQRLIKVVKARDAQGTPTQSAGPTQSAAHSQRTASVQGTASFHSTAVPHDSDAVQGTATSQGTAEIQRTADFQGTAEPHDAASIPKSPNDYTPTDASQTSGGDEGLLDIYALNREVRRLKKQTLSQAKQIIKLKAKLKKLSKFVQPVVKHHAFWVENQNLKKQKRRRKKHKKKVSSVKLGRNKDEGTLSEEHNVQEEDTTHPFFDDIADQDAAVTPDLERKSDETEEVNIEEKEASNVKSGETEELDLETTQSTARQGTITPRTLNFEDEAGPSSPLRPIQVMESEEQLKAAEVLVSISRPRGLSIPGPIQTQPQQPTQGTDPKDKGKGILVEEPKKKKLTLQQIRALETTNDEEVARKIQAEWDAEEERKRFEELKKTKPKTTLRKPTSLAQERNQMMNFLKGQGYKNLQKLKYPQMKELYDKVQASIKDSFKDFIPMDSEKEREMLKEREAKRLLRKRKATISEEQPSKKLKLRTETIDELRNYLRIVDFEKNAQDRESLEGISMITELQVIDSPDGEYLIIHRANNHFRAFDTLWEILHILDRQDLYHLYRVVQDYYEHIPPTGLGLILLGDLTTIWETAEISDDDFWKNQEDWEIVRWRLNESSGVHTLELEDGTMIHMLAERRYPLSRELMIRMLEHGMEVEDESEIAIALIHLFILWTTEDGDDS